MQDHAGLISVRTRAHRARNIRGWAALRHRTRQKASRGRLRLRDAIDTKSAEGFAVQVPRDEIPARAGMHESVRLDRTLRIASAAVSVRKRQLVLVAACAGE